LRREPGTCGRDLVEIDRCDLHMSCARMADSERVLCAGEAGGRDGERELDARGQRLHKCTCVCRDIEFVCRAWPVAKRQACVKERSAKLYTPALTR